MEDHGLTNSSTLSLEESIKRVVCIEDRVFASAMVTEVISPGGSEAIKDPVQGENALDIKVVDVVEVNVGSSKSLEIDTVTGIAEVDEEKKSPSAASLTPGEFDQSKANAPEVANSKEVGQVIAGDADVASDSDSEDDLQLIVNDEDIFYPHGIEGAEEAEGEEMFVVAGDEHYEELDWAAEMHYHHSQFKYVRPGSGPATTSPGVQDVTPGAKTPGAKGPLPFTAGAMGPMSSYTMGLWNFAPFHTYEFVLPPSKTVFDIDIDQFEDKPWDYPGTDLTDYFNFGFTEETWKQYCEDFARIRGEASAKSKMRSHENGHLHQAWGYDSPGYPDSLNTPEPQQRGRSRGMRNHLSGRAIQVEGGGSERRPSTDMRRQRLRDSGSVIQIALQDSGAPGRSHGRHENHGDFRRKQRNEDLQRRKGFPRQVQSADQPPLGGTGRLTRGLSGSSFGQTSPSGAYNGGMFVSPAGGRTGVYNNGRGQPSAQGSLTNGFRRHSTDNSGRPWRNSGRKIEEQFEDEDEGSYGSSGHSDSRESDRDDSEDDYVSSRSHRLRRFSNQPLEKRLGRSETRPVREKMPVPERRTVKPLRYMIEDEEKRSVPEKKSELLANNKRSPQRVERSSASAQVVTQKRSSELITEKRSSPPFRRSIEVTHSRSTEAIPEKKPAIEKQPVPEKKLQSISERRAQLISERKAKLLAEKNAEKNPEKKSELTIEKKPQATSAEPKVDQTEKDKVVVQKRSLKLVSKESLGQPQQVRTAAKSTLISKTEERPKLKQPDAGVKDDLRMKVLEKVSARWKLHLRMDDAHAKRKRENLNKPVHRKGAEEGNVCSNGLDGAANENERKAELSPGIEKMDVEVADSKEDRRKEKKEERKRRHKERKERRRQEDNARTYIDHDQFVDDERWQMEDVEQYDYVDRKRKRRQRERENKYEEDYDIDDQRGEEFISSRRSHLKSRGKGNMEYEEEDVDGWEVKEEGECEDDGNADDLEYEDDRWKDEFDDHRRKRRRYNYEAIEGDQYYEYETDAPYDDDGVEEMGRGYAYDGSTSSGQVDGSSYRRRGRTHHRDSDRWTGTYDSGEEGYDQYDQYDQ